MLCFSGDYLDQVVGLLFLGMDNEEFIGIPAPAYDFLIQNGSQDPFLIFSVFKKCFLASKDSFNGLRVPCLPVTFNR